MGHSIYKSSIDVAAATIKIIIIIIKIQCSLNSNIPATNISGNLLGKSAVTVSLVLILQGTPISWPTRPLGLGTWQEVSTPSKEAAFRG